MIPNRQDKPILPFRPISGSQSEDMGFALTCEPIKRKPFFTALPQSDYYVYYLHFMSSRSEIKFSVQKFVLIMLIRFVMSCIQVSVYTHPINFLKVSATPEKQVL